MLLFVSLFFYTTFPVGFFPNHHHHYYYYYCNILLSLLIEEDQLLIVTLIMKGKNQKAHKQGGKSKGGDMFSVHSSASTKNKMKWDSSNSNKQSNQKKGDQKYKNLKNISNNQSFNNKGKNQMNTKPKKNIQFKTKEVSDNDASNPISSISLLTSNSSSQGTTDSDNNNNGKLSKLQQQFLKKLEGARFRTINEELYTTRGDKAFQEFQAEPSKFMIYHKGYREQAAGWPINPLDYIISWIDNMPNKSSLAIADMGCGEARLGRTLASKVQKVHSFDLVAINDTVIACDIAHVPLTNNSVDIVVFCLSLMGVNYIDFLAEAFRILKKDTGILKIIEVKSRFEDGKGIKKFCQVLKSAGFVVFTNNSGSAVDGDATTSSAGNPNAHPKALQQQATSMILDNKMFFMIECRKVAERGNFVVDFELKPCQYKKR